MRAARRRRLFLPIAGLVVISLIVLFQFGEPLRVASSSMTPTLGSGDHVVVDKRAYRDSSPARGELVVFMGPGGRLLKRVAATAGDEVAIEDGLLVVNGRTVAEPAVDQSRVDGSYFGPVEVPAGKIFVLGDNRADSVDSRTFGPIPLVDVIGRVTFRLWPGTGTVAPDGELSG